MKKSKSNIDENVAIGIVAAFVFIGIGIASFWGGHEYEQSGRSSLYSLEKQAAELPDGTIFYAMQSSGKPYYLDSPIEWNVPLRQLVPARDPIIERNIGADPKLTEPNANPVSLNSEGKAAIFYKPGSYRVSLYSPSEGNICNGKSLGSKIWEAIVDVFKENGRKYSGGMTQYFTQEGIPMKGGLVCIQKAGTTIPETTYKRPTW